MRVKTDELIGVALDWTVAKIEGLVANDGNPKIFRFPYILCFAIREHPNTDAGHFHPSNNWAQGGPIIERERIGVTPNVQMAARVIAWCARRAGLEMEHPSSGPTPLIAAMRCYVASRLGNEVDIPEKFLS